MSVGSPPVRVMTEAVAASMAARAELTFCLDTSNVVCFHFTDACDKIYQSRLCICMVVCNIAMVIAVSLHCRCPEEVGMQHCTGFPLFPGQQPVLPGCSPGGPVGPSAAEGSGSQMEHRDVSLEMEILLSP